MPKFKFLITETTTAIPDPITHSKGSAENIEPDGGGMIIYEDFATEKEAREQECCHTDEHKSQLWELHCSQEFKTGDSHGGVDVLYIGRMSDEEVNALDESLMHEALEEMSRMKKR